MPHTRQRHYLGWDGPALPHAVAWLRDHHGQPAEAGQPGGPGAWDLSHLLIAVPVARAGRRLMELLTEQRGDTGALTPPTVCVVGDLPDRFCPPPTEHRLATDSRAMLTWLRVLREIGHDNLSHVVPNPPQATDVMGWWRLADRFRRLVADLAAGGLTLDDVLDAHRQGTIDLPRPPRWEALRAIEQAYHDMLAADDLIDRQRHRLQTLRAGSAACEQQIVLLGAPDIAPLTASLLRQLDTPVTALIHAPQAHADGFDDLGALVPDYWRDQSVPLEESSIRVVDRTTDQPTAVAAAVGAMNEARVAAARDPLAPDQVTVGLGDETQAGAVRRALQRAGAPARTATGRPFEWTPPAVLLSALSRFVERYRLDAFAELVRHPDVTAYLRAQLRRNDAGADWLTLLDDYISNSLRAEMPDQAIGNSEKLKALARAYRAVADLLPDQPRQRRPLPAWAKTISEALSAFYADRELVRHQRDDEAVITALQTIGDVLRDHAHLDPEHDVTPRVTLSEAMRLTLAEARGRNVPEPGGTSAVEVLGFLELPLDDAPAIIVTSLNEQHIPTTPRADAFLPDGMRHALGLPDAAYRYARDKLLLLATVHGRSHVSLIAPRRAAEGDPLTPSRLLLACDQATRTHRVRRFYDDDVADRPVRHRLLTPGARNRFLIPHPGQASEVLEELHVTAFRDYLDCPYRFYLKHVQHLTARDDRATELDAMQFGTVAHAVLEAFAREGPSDSDDAQTIQAYLTEALDAHFHFRFGAQLRPALHIQRQQLIERLEAFAAQQAQLASEGWRIAHAEQSLSATITVDNQPFTLRGKIDRIDEHEEHGYRIIDYKTGDTAKKPEKTHRARVTRTHRPDDERDAEGWVDLQLPLYLDLAEQVHALPRGRAMLAQFNLPRKLDEVRLHVAAWDEDVLDEAARVRDWVVRQLRAGRFWPPQEPGGWPDEFTWVCADDALDRPGLIHQSATAASDAPGGER